MAGRMDPAAAERVMREAGLEPLEPYPGRAVAPWQCRCMTCGSTVSPSYNAIQQGGGCRACYRSRQGLDQRKPEAEAWALMRAAKVEPLEPYPGSQRPWRSRCMVCGSEVTPVLNNLRKPGRGACKYCGRKKAAESKGWSSAEVLSRMQEAGVELLEPYSGNSQRLIRARCLRCSREVRPRPYSVLARGHDPCIYCARTRIAADEAIALLRELGAEPLSPFPGARDPWRCGCLRCGREIWPRYHAVRRGANPCKFCSFENSKGRRPTDLRSWLGESLSAEKAVSRALAAGVEPQEPYPGKSSATWRCKCLSCETEFSSTLAYLTANKYPCPQCASDGRRMTKRRPQNEALDLIRNAGAEPQEPYTDGATPWKCRCLACGEEISPRLNLVAAGVAAHPYCPKAPTHGFNRRLPAIIYLVTHPELGVHKVGIAGQESIRLETHRRAGWKIHRTQSLESGAMAHRVEQSVLAWLRREKECPAVPGTGNGWTETVAASEISLQSLWKRISREISAAQNTAIR